ncbi:MAG: flagellar hook-length control protein FliK [Gammaproteobacteria bacterium]|nr:flagellar hook-length control protein FliK [Gammaproteobacteria bacterium]
MDNGALPVPQGLMALLGGLLPARQVTGEAAENHGFQDLLSQLLAGGDLTLEDLRNADVPQVLLPLLAGGDGNTLPLETLPPQTLPLQDGSGSPGGDPAADLEAILAFLGAQPSLPSPSPGAPEGKVAGVPGQGPPPVGQDQAEMVPAALFARGGGDTVADGGRETALPAAGGPDKSAITSLQPAAGGEGLRLASGGGDILAALESAASQGQSATKGPEQAGLPVTRAAEPPLQNLPAATIQTPVGRPEWGNELGQRVLWMTAGQGTQHAEIRLNPPQLGPLEVKVVVRNEEVSVFFNANHASTREALEQAMPRLRDMLGANGIQLAEATVSGGRDDPGGDAAANQERGGGGAGTGGRHGAGGADEGPGLSPPTAGPSRGLVDAYV